MNPYVDINYKHEFLRLMKAYRRTSLLLLIVSSLLAIRSVYWYIALFSLIPALFGFIGVLVATVELKHHE